jgi:predicted RNase H-like HicB family nuclease
MSNYRVLVHFDPDRSVYIARAPELEHCSAEGTTRAEALSKVEEEMNAQLDVIREQGGSPPVPFDGNELAYSGELGVKVSRTLHRDLAWQARAEGIEMSQLLAEILAGGLDSRRQRARRPNPPQAQAAPPPGQAQLQPGDEGGGNTRNPAPRRDFSQGGGRRGERNDPRYHAIMEDRATFLEYVRGLEQGGGQPQRPRGDRGRRGPRGGGEGG